MAPVLQLRRGDEGPGPNPEPSPPCRGTGDRRDRPRATKSLHRTSLRLREAGPRPSHDVSAPPALFPDGDGGGMPVLGAMLPLSPSHHVALGSPLSPSGPLFLQTGSRVCPACPRPFNRRGGNPRKSLGKTHASLTETPVFKLHAPGFPALFWQLLSLGAGAGVADRSKGYDIGLPCDFRI